MSYISLLLPAFHLNTTDISEIVKQCGIQFGLSPDKFEIVEINDKSPQINYGIKFKESFLSLSSIEDLIYQKDSMQTLTEKTFESLHSMSQKLNELINSFKENGNNEEFKKDLMSDNIKLKELLVSQIEYSDNFRLNTEKTLNRIKDEFRTIVQELETLKKKSNNKDDNNETIRNDGEKNIFGDMSNNNLNGSSNNIFGVKSNKDKDKRSNEKNDTFNYEYTIKTTQNSNIYNGENIDLSEGWEKADDGFCPKLCRQCDKNGKCIKCKSGYKIYDENENICHDIVPNCKEYEGDEDNLICKQCINNNFFLAQEDNGTIICQENSKSDEYYNQTGLNYRIKCHKQYTNCYKCDSEMCKICKDNYKLIDDVENGMIFCSPNFKGNIENKSRFVLSQ